MSGLQATGRAYRVLLLPATRRDGDAIASFLSKHGVECEICANAGMAVIALSEDVGVFVLTDQVLAASSSHLIADSLANQPSWSDLPVVFLSKIGDESRAMSEMLSRMTNTILLERPASTRTLLSAIQAALRSRGKQYQIRDQLLALQDAEQALRESDRRKDEFLAMLAHELRNPLAPIRTAAELLPRLIAAGDPRTGAVVSIVSRQAQQLTRLVDDLLDVSRITQGRIEIQRAAVDLTEVVDQAIESVESQIKEKRHTVRTDVAPGLFVDGDGARLVQCVSNLLTNAVKYTETGGRINVTLRRERAHAVLTVSDNGIGIPAELLPRVFDLFVQNERALDRSQGGLGIGLSVVRRLLEMQGGTVTAASPGAGKGSTFQIVLPAIAPPIGMPLALPVKVCSSLRILIVDDNEDAADSLMMLLSIDGHIVHAVYDGVAALAAAPTFRPDLILLDIGLPSMNGYEVAERLRATGVKAKLVALSGYGQEDDVEKAREAGFDAHVAKPVELVRLKQMLKEVAAPKA